MSSVLRTQAKGKRQKAKGKNKWPCLSAEPHWRCDGQCRNSSVLLPFALFPFIRAHQTRLSERVAVHRIQQLLLRLTGWQIECGIKRIELEVVAMRLARRRARAAIADLAEVIAPLL